MSQPRLDRLLTLEAPQDVPDGAGGYARLWMPLGQHWAEVTPGSGRETVSGTAPISAVSVKIVVRASPIGSLSRPRPDQRFREGARVFRIAAVAETDPRGRYLTCHSVEEEVA